MTNEPQLSGSPVERYLQAWHWRHADACRVFEGARDHTGQSSYQRLASLSRGANSVLDVACGTGTLLSLIGDVAEDARIAGVDLSVSQLQLARRRLAGGEFTVARAQALPFPDASFDVVVCHMALMLMDNPECVLAESHRVLRPRGRFGAIANRMIPLEGIAKTILSALRALRETANVALLPPPIGDSRTHDSATLLTLVGEHFEQTVIESFTVTQLVPKGELWPYLVHSVYGLDALSAKEAEEVLMNLSLPDAVPWSVPMVQVTGSVPA